MFRIMGLVAAAAQAASLGSAVEKADLCLVVVAENIAEGQGNFYLYAQISDAAYTIQKGDRLEYDIYLPGSNPMLRGGVDADFKRKDLPAELDSRPWLRDQRLVDARDLYLHGDSDLEPARDRWYHRSFDLSKLAGVTLERWTVQFEGDRPGRYIQFLDNIRVTRDGQPVFAIYDNGPAPEVEVRLAEGYSRTVLITTATRDEAMSDGNAAQIIEEARRVNQMRTARDAFRTEMDVARTLARHLKDENLVAQVDEVTAMEDAQAFDAGRAEPYYESLRRARQELSHAHSAMRQFTGHLVGHAHIDLQWLWTWDETVDQIIPQTFGQALKFMDEFPEFTFSQSSAALYLAAEQHHPELFRRIQERVKDGRWELVGGRWCEGDTNMISPESHVRHFLYGQRYFQDRFGRRCNVGWEPDTFGHVWTMPQILKKAGVDYYYFCRAGQGVPLFWWEGPDGSRVLAFDESATGGWYTDVVDDEKVRELARFVEATNAQDHLMVYGVGNHGGGPTRENIDAALRLKERELLPTVRFSTAEAFFARLAEGAEGLIVPTIRDELNPVFEGCYTTHARIKRYNRRSESLLEMAEVFASLARLHGPAYPREAFETLWRDVLWSHHHDTVPGSLIHPSALYSHEVYEKLLERGESILDRACQTLARDIEVKGRGPHLVVFNPLAWERTEVVDATLTLPAGVESIVLVDESGDVPTQILERRVDGDVATFRLCFEARSVPGCGYKTFSTGRPRGGASAGVESADPPALANPPKFVVLQERPHGMSAWTVGEYVEATAVGEPKETRVLERGPVRFRVRQRFLHDRSTIIQDTVTYAGSPRVDFETTVEWLQYGSEKGGGPMLKVAFPTGVDARTATYEIPFGDIARPNDGHENVALKWCDLSSDNAGVTILNDCKHAYDVADGVVRLTLLRSAYSPDPTPDIGMHHMRYARLDHEGPLNKAAVVRAGWEFNKPMRVRVVDGRSGSSAQPPAWAGCEAGPANVIVTALKRSEDNDDVILRAYECAGAPASATIKLGFDATSAREVDLLERDMEATGSLSLDGRTDAADFKPYEIRTFRIVVPPPATISP